MKRQRKRTLKDYEALYRNPLHLAPPGPASTGAEVILFPNGEREIWVRSGDGFGGMRIRISDGPAGLSIHVNSFVGTADMDVVVDAPGRDIGLVQYRSDQRSQAFRRWYKDNSAGSDTLTEADIAILGESYRRKAV